MTGLELLKAPEATAGEIADIISAPCPPTIPAHCDGVSCRECWLTWLTGEPIKEKEPPDKRTAPDDAPAYYHPPVKAIREAAQSVRTYDLILKLLENETKREALKRMRPARVKITKAVDRMVDIYVGAGLIALATLGFAAALLLMRCPVPAVSVTAFIGVAVSLGWAVIRK